MNATPKTMQDVLNLVLVILSIGTILAPIFFGFILWKMLSVFVSKEQFESFKTLSDTQRQFLIDGQTRLEKKVDYLIENNKRRA